MAPFCWFLYPCKMCFPQLQEFPVCLAVSSVPTLTVILMPLLSSVLSRSPALVSPKITLDVILWMFILFSLQIWRYILVPPSSCLFGSFPPFVSKSDLFIFQVWWTLLIIVTFSLIYLLPQKWFPVSQCSRSDYYFSALTVLNSLLLTKCWHIFLFKSEHVPLPGTLNIINKACVSENCAGWWACPWARVNSFS